MPRTTRKPHQIAARLTEEGKRLLSLMATDQGISESAVIERAIRELARKDGYIQRSSGDETTNGEYRHGGIPGKTVNES